MTRAQLAVLAGPGDVRVLDADTTVEDPGPDEVVVTPAYVGLCGTDLELFHGASPYLRDGRTAYPHHFGHEWVGTVSAVGTAVHSVTPGETVTGSTMLWCGTCDACARGRRNCCTGLREVGLYGHAGAAAHRLRVPARTVASFGRPSGGPQPHHVLAEPLVTVLEAVSLAEIATGDRVLVSGGGTIGLLAAAVLARYPVTVDLLDPAPPKAVLDETDWFARQHTDASTLPARGYDLVLECSGATGAFTAALPGLVPGGRCVLVGVSDAAEPVTAGTIALDGLRVSGVRHGVDHYPTAVALLDELGVTGLVDGVFPLAEAAAAFARLDAPRGRPKVVLGLG